MILAGKHCLLGLKSILIQSDDTPKFLELFLDIWLRYEAKGKI